jgi:hypothetical protein
VQKTKENEVKKLMKGKITWDEKLGAAFIPILLIWVLIQFWRGLWALILSYAGITEEYLGLSVDQWLGIVFLIIAFVVSIVLFLLIHRTSSGKGRHLLLEENLWAVLITCIMVALYLLFITWFTLVWFALIVPYRLQRLS